MTPALSHGVECPCQSSCVVCVIVQLLRVPLTLNIRHAMYCYVLVSVQKTQLSHVQRKREDTGVALYSAQQLLAKQQMKLERAEDRRAAVIAAREAASRRLEEIKEHHDRITQRREAIDAQGVHDFHFVIFSKE